MEQFMSWEEIKKCFPNEHVVIVNPKCPPEFPSLVEGGEILDHDQDFDRLLKRCDTSDYDSVAFMYTGDRGELIGERGLARVVLEDD